MASVDNIHSSHAAHGGSSLFARAAASVERVREAWATRAVYRRTLHELSALSDHDLADLGLNRSNLQAVAYEAAHTK